MLVQPPKQRLSAAWAWSLAMLCLGLAALIGGIDHGFVEPAGLSRTAIQKLNWLVLGAMTLAVVLTIAGQFFEGRASRVIVAVGVVQFAVFVVAVLAVDAYLVVIANYAPVMLWFLVMNLLHRRRSPGAPAMVAGTLVLLFASALQALGIDAFSPLDRNGLYHVVSIPGVFLLYLGGRRLRTTRAG